MDSAYIFPIILQLIGIFIIAVEVLIPSGGLLALVAASLLGFSLFNVFSSISTSAGIGFVVADLIIVPATVVLVFKFLAKTSVMLGKKLSSKQGVLAHNDFADFVGQEGVSLTDLRPSGIARISDRRLDVITDGKYLKKNTPIIVTSVAGSRILVKEHHKRGDE